MSKHDTIIENLKQLTQKRSFARPVKGWELRRPIGLSDMRGQSAELCGTRFWEGALVRYPATRAEIVVGGTCLKTLLESWFPKKFNRLKARRATRSALAHHYPDAVDPRDGLRASWRSDTDAVVISLCVGAAFRLTP